MGMEIALRKMKAYCLYCERERTINKARRLDSYINNDVLIKGECEYCEEDLCRVLLKNDELI